MNSIGKIIERYKRNVDVALLDEQLKKTPEERIRALEEFDRFREELQTAVERHGFYRRGWTGRCRPRSEPRSVPAGR